MTDIANFNSENKHDFFMSEAIKEARKAEAKGEVPVGAVLVIDDEIVARSFNTKEESQVATNHAELKVIQEANKNLDSWRLNNATLYSTVEPCAMCAGAIIQSRIDTLYYGVDDPKFGGVVSLYNILTDPRSNHQVKVHGGLLKDDATSLMKDFFSKIRNKNKKIV